MQERASHKKAQKAHKGWIAVGPFLLSLPFVIFVPFVLFVAILLADGFEVQLAGGCRLGFKHGLHLLQGVEVFFLCV